MSDFKDRLEQERRRYAMGGDSFGDLERRRDRKRRNRRLGSGLVALAIAAAGIGAGLYAFRPTGQGKPADTPTPQPSVTAPEPSPSGTPTGVPPVEGLIAPAVSGPIQFVDAEHGWMVDGGGQILATTDGGQTWKIQASGPSNIMGIDMLSDGVHGWGVGDGGLIETSDGGAHWVTWGNQSLSSIQFLTQETGWGVESGDQLPGRLMKTDDGGRTWTAAPGAPSAGSVCFADQQQGWAVGLDQAGDPTFYRTQDGGSTWTSDPMPLPAGWGMGSQTVRCDASGIEASVVVIGEAAAGSQAYAGVDATVEGGGSLNQHVVFVSALASGVFHPEGAAVVDDPYAGVFAVADRGSSYYVNWCPACEGKTFVTTTHGEPAAVNDRIELPTIPGLSGPEEPLGISFVDREHGWVLVKAMGPQGQQTAILETTDGGASWTIVCGQPSNECSGVQSVP